MKGSKEIIDLLNEAIPLLFRSAALYTWLAGSATGVEFQSLGAKFEEFGELPNPNANVPEGVPDAFEARMQVMYDMIALAFETDSTRLVTLQLLGTSGVPPSPSVTTGTRPSHSWRRACTSPSWNCASARSGA